MILYGKPVAEAIELKIKARVSQLAPGATKPFLAVILAGRDAASQLYTQKKKEKAESLGIGIRIHHLPENTPEQNIIDLIELLNQNKTVTGIIIQLPLPEGLLAVKILAQIKPAKDVDGLNNGFPPATAGAILELLDFYDIDLNGKKIVIVGHGKLVGAPLEKILTDKNLDVTVCDSQTLDLKPITLGADIIISGVGKPGLIAADMVKPSAIIIDAGTSESSGATVGDVDIEVYKKVSSYSPVPGGVGPVTVAKLLKNVVEAAGKM